MRRRTKSSANSDVETNSPRPGPVPKSRQNLMRNRMFCMGFVYFTLGFMASSFLFLTFSLDLGRETNEYEVRDQRARGGHRLAIVVPFRDRFDELKKFVPHMSEFLRLKSIDYKIYIINQIDEYRFNRASLINVGFLASMDECDYMVMHDVDLLPLNDLLDYSYPANGPYHVSSPGLHPEYDYATFIGGVLIVRKEDFLKTNGMSNRYWGWGREDDDLYMRFKEANLSVQRPDVGKFKTGKRFTFWHNHDPDKRPRDKKRYAKQKKESLVRDSTGLDSVQYRIDSVDELTINGYPFTVIDVVLFCNKLDTHWCDFQYQFYQ